MKFIVTFAGSNANQKELITISKLGEGQSEVFHVKGVSCYEDYALKLFPDALQDRFLREKERVASLSHPHIIKHYPIAQHDTDFNILITEYAQHGDFFDFVIKGALDHEVHIRSYFHQLISGLEHMHAQGIAHLDLKLENLLLDKDFLLKITDFDQSHTYHEKCTNRLGTHSYRAPEIIEKNCKDIFAADIYSLGVILYIFKARQFPFIEVEEDGQIKMMSYELFMENYEEFWRVKAKKLGKKSSFFTEDFKKLLRGMLEKDPSKRFTLQDIKKSEWYNKPTLNSESLKTHMTAIHKKLNQKPNTQKKKNIGAKLFKIFLF